MSSSFELYSFPVYVTLLTQQNQRYSNAILLEQQEANAHMSDSDKAIVQKPILKENYQTLFEVVMDRTTLNYIHSLLLPKCCLFLFPILRWVIFATDNFTQDQGSEKTSLP